VRLANDLKRRRHWIKVRAFEQRYFRMLNGLLGGITKYLTHDDESLKDSRNTATWPVRLFGLNPFTEGSYLLCLRLALIYPLLGVFVVWLLGREGALAGITLLPADEPIWWRVLTVGWLGAMNFAPFKHFRSKEDRYRTGTDHASSLKPEERDNKGLSYWHSLIYLSVVVVVGIFANVVAVTVAGAISAVSVGAVAVTVTLAGAVSTVPAATVVIAVAATLIVDFFAASIRRPCTSKGAITGFWLGFNVIHVGTVFLVLAWVLSRANDPEPLLLPVFLVLLPLANAFLDWLSLSFTRGLLHAIGSGHHKGLVALGFAGLDILLALVFLFAIASLTILILSVLNLATVTWGGRALLDLQLLLNGLALEPDALEFGWIHFMMLSTLIPTLVHFFVAGFATVLVLPERWSRWILNYWDTREDARAVAFGWISLAPLLALAGPALLLWGLFELLTAWGGTVGHLLLAWVHAIALAVDPSTTAPLP